MELNAGWAQIAATALSILCSFLGFIVWHLYQGVRAEAKAATAEAEANKTELATYKLYVAEHYVTQNELTKAVGSLEKSIDRLIDAVNRASAETRSGFIQLHQRIDEKADKRPA